MNNKICSKCDTERSIDQYTKMKQSRDGHRPNCKICERASEKERRARNKDKISKYNKDYRTKNHDKMVQYHRDWYDKNLKDKGANSDNPEYYKHYRDMVNKTQAERLKVDMSFKIKRNIGRMMKNFFNKTRHTYDIVGCTQELFHEWILWQANLDDIDIQKYGIEYHIDHVMPCASFLLTDEEEQKWCFNWSNMRPMLASENIIKGNKIDRKAINQQEIRAISYILHKKAQQRLGEIKMDYIIRND